MKHFTFLQKLYPKSS